MTEIHLTINGQSVVAQAGQTVLEAARAAGIDIPTLCYHPALSNWGACRMCLVEVKKMRGLQTACTCPAAEGMEVETDTPATTEVRKFVLELLFSERNHYCMFCQMSGDCELQAAAYRYGLDHFTYPRPYTKLGVDATRKYFIMDQNRCILCTRCIRACNEIVANHTLSIRERGAKSMIMADLNVPFGESTCVECGTCLQVCPTGALIDAKSAYGGREKDVTHTQTTCMQCSVGCQLDVVTRYQRLLRVDGLFDAAPSHGLLCADGRFKPLYEERKRVEAPLVRQDGQLAETSWDEALALVAGKLKAGNAEGLALCATTDAALAAFARLFEKAGGQAGTLEPVAPALGYGKPAQLSDILDADLIIVAGAQPLDYQRVVGYYVQRAMTKGVLLAVIANTPDSLSEKARITATPDNLAKVVDAAATASKIVLIYSVGAAPATLAAFSAVADKVYALPLSPARNGAGAAAAGLLPIKPNGAATQYFLLGEQSEDTAFVGTRNGAFAIVQASYHSALVDQADVVLPAPIWVERSGAVTDMTGVQRTLNPALPMPAQVRDEAEVLAQLAEMVSR
ncbi:MAG TPA: 2Fe-2S iron-sulfur cluster-binding protein [Anaerolineae bacterium]|nr:2Fe-2S iron-sulfur cluster-binding protein [Anaerolineae bacterium]